MNITPKTIGFAIHGLLAARQIGQGCSLPLRALAEDWPQTKLRKTDLGLGLEALRKGGYVRLEQSPQGAVVRLLDESFGMIRTLHDREAVATLRLLREKRQRPQGHLTGILGTPSGRRNLDPPADGAAAAH